MNKVALAILSLLSRGPLSGYDLKRLMNDRITPFLKVSNNQVYPQITKLADKGLIRLHAVTQETYHPEKKTYEITAAGVQQLQQLATADLSDPVTQDGFQLKMYNAWLLDTDDFLTQIAHEKLRHQQKQQLLKERLNRLNRKESPQASTEQVFSSWALLTFGEKYESMYIDWCDQLERETKKRRAK